MIGRSALLAAFVAGCGVSHSGVGEQGEGADAATEDGAIGAGATDAGAVAMTGPVTSIIGEIHLHQFPSGGHAWAEFLDTARPVSDVRGDSITEVDTAPTMADGPCTLYVSPTCAPSCAGATYCAAPQTCAPLVESIDVDAGEIHVTGSSVVATIRLRANATGSYLAEPPPGSARLFAGGDLLALAGGASDNAFTGQLPAPPPVAVTSPDWNAALHLPTVGPLSLAWTSEHSDEMVVRIFASGAGRGSAYIRCDLPDLGALKVSSAMMAGLPAPPRTTRLEIERAEQRIFPIARPGVGVLAHAAQTSWKNGTD